MLRKSLSWVGRHRGRLAGFSLVGAVVFAGLQLHQLWPRATDLELWLGEGHSGVVELRLSYQQDGSEYHGTRLHFPRGAPQAIPVATDLPSGQFDLNVLLVGRDGSVREVSRQLQIPLEGRLRLHLDQPGKP